VQRALKLRSLIAAIGVKLEQEGIQAEQGCHQQNTAIAILNVRCVDNGMQEQSLSIYKDRTFLAFDFLASVVAARVDAAPLFQRFSRSDCR
jgi:hypothetical protein